MKKVHIKYRYFIPLRTLNRNLVNFISTLHRSICQILRFDKSVEWNLGEPELKDCDAYSIHIVLYNISSFWKLAERAKVLTVYTV